MKFYHFAVITSLVLVPLAAGHPPRHHGPNPPRGPNKPHRGGHKPPRNLRQEERRAKGRKGENDEKPKEETETQDTNLLQAKCDTPNPLSRLDSGCPCFDQARVSSLIDLSNAVSCDFYQSLPIDDPCNYSGWEYTGLSASSPEETLPGEPPIYQNSYVSFSANKDSDPAYGSTCYASVDVSKSSISYKNFDFEEFLDDIGKYYYAYITVSVTDAEYGACLDILNQQKAQLPDNCYIGTDEWY